jgi:hypothetical protein
MSAKLENMALSHFCHQSFVSKESLPVARHHFDMHTKVVNPKYYINIFWQIKLIVSFSLF